MQLVFIYITLPQQPEKNNWDFMNGWLVVLIHPKFATMILISNYGIYLFSASPYTAVIPISVGVWRKASSKSRTFA